MADTTFCRIRCPHLCPWEYFRKEKKDFALLYQVVVSLGKPFRILSFDGPFKGSAADVTILRETIKPQLFSDELVMCDKGYLQEEQCWCPPSGPIQSLSTRDKFGRRCVTRIRQLNERVIGRLKMWGMMRRKWNLSWRLHKSCAHVVSRLTQLELILFPLT